MTASTTMTCDWCETTEHFEGLEDPLEAGWLGVSAFEYGELKLRDFDCIDCLVHYYLANEGD